MTKYTTVINNDTRTDEQKKSDNEWVIKDAISRNYVSEEYLLKIGYTPLDKTKNEPCSQFSKGRIVLSIKLDEYGHEYHTVDLIHGYIKDNNDGTASLIQEEVLIKLYLNKITKQELSFMEAALLDC